MLLVPIEYILLFYIRRYFFSQCAAKEIFPVESLSRHVREFLHLSRSLEFRLDDARIYHENQSGICTGGINTAVRVFRNSRVLDQSIRVSQWHVREKQVFHTRDKSPANN